MVTSVRRPAPAGAWAVPLHSHNPRHGGTPRSANHQSNAAAAAPRTELQEQNAQNSSSTSKSPVGEYEDSDYSSEEPEDGKSNLETQQAAIFGDYGGAESIDDANDAGIAKIRALLVAARSGGTACLICLERIRASDYVWDCKSGCFTIFHLTCIQSWARQALNAAEQRALFRLSAESFPGAAADSARWHCPKCRAEYLNSQIPREYRCFCGKEVNPGPDPWLTPHTCGEKCGRKLEGDCGHECKLLCHPGPCPPCPQLVKIACFCGSAFEVRRCGRSKFSCGSVCRKILACGKDRCESQCHEGECPLCKREDRCSCQCGKEAAIRPCVDSNWRCGRPCERQLSCKKHWCDRGCHAGPCGECRLAGKRSCPCGKKEYKDVACDVAIPTCGSTCEKTLSCSRHRCQERCHTGPCNTTCRVVLVKACHCGGLKKEVPCYQEFQCERKCLRMRDCTRHACKKRCCDGDCPPCQEICGRRLRCGNHKCPSPCHRDACAPCPVSVRISCSCGGTSFEVTLFEKVPCGMEKDQKPPRCSKRCQVPPRCSHGPGCKPHSCHYGPCPPCRLPCNAELPCGHRCTRRCHGPRPVSNPEYSLKPKKKKKIHEDPSAAAGRPCPPCTEIVSRQCLGQHLGIEREMVCSEAKDFWCGNACGNLLACGNHFCDKSCHRIQAARSRQDSFSAGAGEPCEQCPLDCEKKRALCTHPCPLPCHPGDCPPCRALVKRVCYCETLTHVYDCDKFTSASVELRAKMLSCGGPCHRKLPYCTHMCSDICHPGACLMATSCRKKVQVRCACQRLKKEWLCFEVQAAQRSSNQEEGARTVVGLLACDQVCLKLAAEKRAKEEAEQQLRQRRPKEAEVEVAAPVKGKRKKNRYQIEEQNEATKFQRMLSAGRKWATLALVILLVCLIVYSGYKGLFALNDWMNRRDTERLKRRPPFRPRF